MKPLLKKGIVVKHGPALARLFSSAVIKQLATRQRSALAARILDESKSADAVAREMSLRDFYDGLFTALSRDYRNEYVYKNAIANKILLGRHSLNTSFMLTEFRAGNCKADAVVVNGTSNVYEVKSEFDSTTRLARQMGAYRQVFDQVHVITSAAQLDAVTEIVDASAGLMVLNNRGAITTVREPTSQKSRVIPAVVFDSLRQNEYVRIVSDRFGSLPDLPNTQIYRTCRDLFCQLPPVVAHDEMVKVLRERGGGLLLREFVQTVPHSLKAASLACRLTHREQASFSGLLHSSARNCLLTA